MRLYTPNPTVILAAHEIEDIVRNTLKSELPAGLRLGNLVGADLEALSSIGSPRTRLTGTLTFELFPKEDQ